MYEEVDRIWEKLSQTQRKQFFSAVLRKISGKPLPGMDKETRAAVNKYMKLLGLQ